MKPRIELGKALARIDALPQRERWTLAAGLFALAIGVQFLMVTPAHDRRVAIESSALADGDAKSQAEASAISAKSQERDALKTQQAHTTQQLATLGLATTQHDSVGALIARTLPDSSVQLVGVQALPVQELDIAAADEPSAAAAVAVPAATAASAVQAAPMLYRHRAELRLEGPVPQLLQALDAVEHRLSPLRVEQVRLTAVPGGVQARVVLTTLSRNRRKRQAQGSQEHQSPPGGFATLMLSISRPPGFEVSCRFHSPLSRPRCGSCLKRSTPSSSTGRR